MIAYELCVIPDACLLANNLLLRKFDGLRLKTDY